LTRQTFVERLVNNIIYLLAIRRHPPAAVLHSSSSVLFDGIVLLLQTNLPLKPSWQVSIGLHRLPQSFFDDIPSCCFSDGSSWGPILYCLVTIFPVLFDDIVLLLTDLPGPLRPYPFVPQTHPRVPSTTSSICLVIFLGHLFDGILHVGIVFSGALFDGIVMIVPDEFPEAFDGILIEPTEYS
jgi:hypothetical protein